MNKTQLVETIAAGQNLKKKDADAIVTSVFEAIANALADGEKVQISGFGSFETKLRGERIGRNPQTKEEIKIPAYKCATFAPSKNLKSLLNK